MGGLLGYLIGVHIPLTQAIWLAIVTGSILILRPSNKKVVEVMSHD